MIEEVVVVGVCVGGLVEVVYDFVWGDVFGW